MTFGVLLGVDEYLMSAQFELELSDDVQDPSRQARPIALFPAHRDATLFSIDLLGSVAMDASANLSASMAGTAVVPFANVKADTALKTKLVAGPFQFAFRKAEVNVIGEGDRRIVWRYNLHSALSGADEFKSFMLIKISEEANWMKISAKLRVVPCKSRWIVFKDRLSPLVAGGNLDVALVSRRGNTA